MNNILDASDQLNLPLTALTMQNKESRVGLRQGQKSNEVN